MPDRAAMMVREKTATAKYSVAPKSRHTFANRGEMKIRATMPIREPMPEARMPTPRARPASPRSAMGPPSKTVEMEEGGFAAISVALPVGIALLFAYVIKMPLPVGILGF
mgnify:CR=1 FL=1